MFSIVVALIATVIAGTLFKVKKAGMATVATFVAAVSAFVAFPPIMLMDTLRPQLDKLPAWFPWIIFAVGVLAALAAAGKNLPNWIIPIGMALAAWALFAYFPNATTAFDHLGPSLWQAIKTFYTEFTQGIGS